jgi:sporulation protein YlmC with PRC-barrel domain
VKTVHFELLLGRKVLDPDGKKVGRILAVRAEPKGEDCVVSEYLLGTAALLTRLGLSAQRLIGIPIHRKPLCVPWDLMDISDPAKPRLTCRVEEIEGGKGRGSKSKGKN